MREKWAMVGSYHDAAISGSGMALRPGIQALLRDAQAGVFDVVLAEALDRILRDQADVATLFKRLSFEGIAIITLAEGEINELHVGLKGTMNALYIKTIARNTHRGLLGRVTKGKSGGGLCYGYRVIKKIDANCLPIRGDREVITEESEVICRIFRAFAAGQSLRSILVELNRERVSGPMGRAWSDTTIGGHVSRGTGILNNELYAGVLVWNRQRFIKDPITEKRVSRPNPEHLWIRTEVPELRIVPDDLWQAVQARQKKIAAKVGPCPANTWEGRARRLHLANRPMSLLSGLLSCGCCGGKIGIIVNGRFGCLNHSRRGICDNNRTIVREKAEAVQAFADEIKRLNQTWRVRSAADRKELSKVERVIAGIMAAIEDGMYQSSMKTRLVSLEGQKADIVARLGEAPPDVPNVHPDIASNYRRNVERFTEALDDPDGGKEATEALRSLIGGIVFTPGEKRGEVHITLDGELMGILDVANDVGNKKESRLMTAGKAGPRNHEYVSAKTKSHPREWLFCVGRFKSRDSTRNQLLYWHTPVPYVGSCQ
ncbi:recombinase family protein [Gluconobacter sp.]|uniref:recombinase family protein n=1 Tax=Gluconobacter sp. TaxID=1876758 RepID=UPI0039E7D03A